MSNQDTFLFFKKECFCTNLLNSFNNLADYIEWKYDKKYVKEVEEIALKVGPVFASVIVKIYVDQLKSVDAKHLGLENECEDVKIEKKEFTKLYKEASSEVKPFLAFISLSPKLVFEHYSKLYEEGVMGAGAFNEYLKIKLVKPDVECLLGDFSIIHCLTDANVCSNLLTTLDLSNVVTSDLFWSTIDIQISYGKTTGKTVSSFDNAVSVMQRIAPVWTQLKISSSTSPETDIESINATPVDEEASVDSIMSAYQGNYSVVPSGYPRASGIAYGLVSNFVNFNKLSNDRKLQVSNFLLNNRSKFNSVLADSAKIIAESIESSSNGMDGVDFTKFGVNSANIQKTANVIKMSYGKIKNADMTTKINYIVNCYLPLINKFKSKLMSDREKYSHVLASLNDGLQILGGGIYDDVDVTPVTEPAQPPVQMDASEAVPFDSIYSMFGGAEEIIQVKTESMSPESMIKEITQLQRDFNHQYEEIYRQIIKNIENIKLPSIYKESINKLYPYCKVFNDIAIKNPKTSIWISGLYGKKNRNGIYTQVVHETIEILKKSGYSCFNEVVNTLGRLENLLTSTNNKAKEIRVRFIRSPKASSSILLIAGKRVKIPCNLTAQDFNAFDMAVNALYWQMRNNASESSILNNKEEIKRYFDRMKNREEIIRQQFNIIDSEIQFRSQKIENISLRTMWLQITKIMNEQLMKCCLYINNVVEPQLTKQKIDAIQFKNLTKAEVTKIEHSFLMFKKAKMSSRYEDEFKLLNRMIKKNKDIFTISNQIKKVISASRYIDFIATLYKEFHLFDDSFNWEQFNNMMLTFMVLNSISVDFGYLLPDVTPEDNYSLSQMKVQSIPSYLMSIAQYIAVEVLEDFSRIEEIYEKLNALNKVYDHEADFVYNANPRTADNAYIIFNNANWIPADKSIKNSEVFMRGLMPYVYGDTANAAANVAYIKLEPVVNNFGISFLSNNVDSSVVKSGNNNIIINAVFDSLLVHVINLFDKYWGMRYSGTLPLPMNINQTLKGGSIFDTNEFHDISNATVIPEAVPFYITGLNICEYYIQKLGKKDNDTGSLNQRLKISEISILYPIAEIFGPKYNVSIKMLSNNQLTTCISIFNDIWNQTSGSPNDKLSTSIDMLLNELNASLFITDGIQNSLIENGYASMDTFSASAMNDVEKVLKVIEEIYKESALSKFNYVTPEDEQIGFERMLNKAYKRIKEVSSDMRMNELKNMLTKDEELHTNMTEYYKFMDLVVSPLVTCYESYRNVFELFGSVHMNVIRAAGNNLEIDLRNRLVKMDNGEIISLWDLCSKSYREDYVIKYLIANPYVQEYNTLLYNSMIVDFNKTGILKVPQFWFVMNKNTYPINPVLKCHLPEQMIWNTAIPVLRQLYPHINPKSLADYFEYTIREFGASVDQCLHLFMSYPGMKDKSIHAIEDSLHDQFKPEKILNQPAVKKIYEVFSTVSVTKSNAYIYPIYNNTTNVPAYIHGDEVIPGIEFNGCSDKYVYLEGTNINGKITFNSGSNNGQGIVNGIHDARKGNESVVQYTDNEPIAVYRNGWTDYMIYVLAKSNQDFVIPYKLAQMIKGDQIITGIAKEMLNTVGKVWGYNAIKARDGSYLNPVTQNIMTRSCSDYNKSITDYITYGQETINNIVAIIPLVMSTLEAAKNSINSSVMYHGLRVVDEINSCMSILSKFYNDISTSVSPMFYLQEGSTKYGKDHPLGEIVKYINVPIYEIHSYTALEWANKYKFSYLSSITYPEFKNSDRFEWIKEYSKNVFTHPIFSQNFKIIIENMANQVWNSVIATTYKNTSAKHNISIINNNDSLYIRQLLGIAMVDGCTNKNDYQYIIDKFFNELGGSTKISEDRINNAPHVMFGGARSSFIEKVDRLIQYLNTHIIAEVGDNGAAPGAGPGAVLKPDDIMANNIFNHNGDPHPSNVRLRRDGKLVSDNFDPGSFKINIDFVNANLLDLSTNNHQGHFGIVPATIHENGPNYFPTDIQVISLWEIMKNKMLVDITKTYKHNGLTPKVLPAAPGTPTRPPTSYEFTDQPVTNELRAKFVTIGLHFSDVRFGDENKRGFYSIGLPFTNFLGKDEFFYDIAPGAGAAVKTDMRVSAAIPANPKVDNYMIRNTLKSIANTMDVFDATDAVDGPLLNRIIDSLDPTQANSNIADQIDAYNQVINPLLNKAAAPAGAAYDIRRTIDKLTDPQLIQDMEQAIPVMNDYIKLVNGITSFINDATTKFGIRDDIKSGAALQILPLVGKYHAAGQEIIGKVLANSIDGNNGNKNNPGNADLAGINVNFQKWIISILKDAAANSGNNDNEFAILSPFPASVYKVLAASMDAFHNRVVGVIHWCQNNYNYDGVRIDLDTLLTHIDSLNTIDRYPTEIKNQLTSLYHSKKTATSTPMKIIIDNFATIARQINKQINGAGVAKANTITEKLNAFHIAINNVNHENNGAAPGVAPGAVDSFYSAANRPHSEIHKIINGAAPGVKVDTGIRLTNPVNGTLFNVTIRKLQQPHGGATGPSNDTNIGTMRSGQHFPVVNTIDGNAGIKNPFFSALKGVIITSETDHLNKLSGGDLANFKAAIETPARNVLLSLANYAPNNAVAEFVKAGIPAGNGRKYVANYLLYGMLKQTSQYVYDLLHSAGKQFVTFELYNSQKNKIEKKSIQLDRLQEASIRGEFNHAAVPAVPAGPAGPAVPAVPAGLEFNIDDFRNKYKVINTKKGGKYIAFNERAIANPLTNFAYLAGAIIFSASGSIPISSDRTFMENIQQVKMLANALVRFSAEDNMPKRDKEHAIRDNSISHILASSHISEFMYDYLKYPSIDIQHLLITDLRDNRLFGPVPVAATTAAAPTRDIYVPFVSNQVLVSADALNKKIDLSNGIARLTAIDLDVAGAVEGDYYNKRGSTEYIKMMDFHNIFIPGANVRSITYNNPVWKGKTSFQVVLSDAAAGAAGAVAPGANIWYVDDRNLVQFDITWLFERIIGKNIDLLSDVEGSMIENYGFLIPTKLTGGMHSALRGLIQPYIEGNKPEEIMKHLYENQVIPYKIFMNLFNAVSAFKTNDSVSIFDATIRYFHKFNISMSNLFNQLCYAQLFMNSVSLKDAMRRLSDVVDNIPDPETKSQHFKMARKYVQHSIGKDGDAVISLFDKSTDDIKIMFDQFNKKFADCRRSESVDDDYINNLVGTDINTYFNAMKSIYMAPTANPNYLIDYIKFTHSGKYSELLQMNSSNLMKLMHRLDLQCTYVNMLVILLRHTSYYDVEKATDKSLFGDFDGEPFDAV